MLLLSQSFAAVAAREIRLCICRARRGASCVHSGVVRPVLSRFLPCKSVGLRIVEKKREKSVALLCHSDVAAVGLSESDLFLERKKEGSSARLASESRSWLDRRLTGHHNTKRSYPSKIPPARSCSCFCDCGSLAARSWTFPAQPFQDSLADEINPLHRFHPLKTHCRAAAGLEPLLCQASATMMRNRRPNSALLHTLEGQCTNMDGFNSLRA